MDLTACVKCGRTADTLTTHRRTMKCEAWCQSCWDRGRQPGYHVDYFPVVELAREVEASRRRVMRGG